jgi:hypothetical protein
MFIAEVYQELFTLVKNLNQLVDIFQKGGGIPIEEYDENEFAGTEGLTHLWGAADILRGSLDLVDYRQPVMTSLFLKRLNDTFEENAENLSITCRI